MPRIRSPKLARIATAAILVLTLAATTPAHAAGPLTDLTVTLTSWIGTWLQPWIGTVPGSTDAEPEVTPAPANRSSRSTEDGIPTPSATDGGGTGPCELICTEAGPGGDPNG